MCIHFASLLTEHRNVFFQCIQDIVLQKFTTEALENHSKGLCRLPWIPKDLQSESSRMEECGNDTQAFQRSMTEFRKQIQAITNSPMDQAACKQPCTKTLYKVLRVTDSCDSALTLSKQAGLSRFAVGLMPVEENIKANVFYTLPNALSDIGGIIGLFFGTSLISLYETLEINLLPSEASNYITYKKTQERRQGAKTGIYKLSILGKNQQAWWKNGFELGCESHHNCIAVGSNKTAIYFPIRITY